MTIRALVEVWREVQPCKNCGRDDYDANRKNRNPRQPRNICSANCLREWNKLNRAGPTWHGKRQELDEPQTKEATRRALNGDRWSAEKLKHAKVDLYDETNGVCMSLLRDPCEFSQCRHHLGPLTREGNKCSFVAAQDNIHTFEAIGHMMGLTRERVRQIEVRGLTKIRMCRSGTMKGFR